MTCNEHRILGSDACAACRDNDRLAVLESQRAALEEANRLAAQRDKERRRAERRAEGATARADASQWAPRDWQAEWRAREEDRERKQFVDERRSAWAERAYGGLTPPTRRERRIKGAVSAGVVVLMLAPLIGRPTAWASTALLAALAAIAAIALRRWLGGSYLMFRFGAFDVTAWLLFLGSLLMAINSTQYMLPADVTASSIVWRCTLLVGITACSYFAGARLARRSRWHVPGAGADGK